MIKENDRIDLLPKRAAAYMRVSTQHQMDEGTSIETQREHCLHYISTHNMVCIAEIVEVFTGTTLDRPEFTRLLELADSGEIDAVVTFVHDRFGRNFTEAMIIRELMLTRGVDMHFTDGGMSRPGPEGLIYDGIKFLFAQFERDKIVQRCRLGRLGRVKEGKILFPFSPYGYTHIDKYTHVIDPVEAEHVRWIFEWYAYGMGDDQDVSLVRVAAELNRRGIPPPRHHKKQGDCWRSSTIRHILQNEIYRGVYYFNKTHINHAKKKVANPREMWIAVEVPELAIIDDLTWLAANRQLQKKRERNPRNRKQGYLLSGHVRCGYCNNILWGRSSRGERKGELVWRRYYHCGEYHDRREVSNGRCPGSLHSVPADLLEQAVWAWLVWLFKDDAALEDGLRQLDQKSLGKVKSVRDRLDVVNGLIKQMEHNITRLIDQFGKISTKDSFVAETINKQVESCSQQREAYIKEKVSLETELGGIDVSDDNRSRIYEIVAQVRERLQDATFEDIRFLLSILDVSCVYKEDRDMLGRRKRSVKIKCKLDYGDGVVNFDKNQLALVHPGGGKLLKKLVLSHLESQVHQNQLKYWLIFETDIPLSNDLTHQLFSEVGKRVYIFPEVY